MEEKALRTYSQAQVLMHGSPEDLWMIVYNKIYDVTSFTDDHPGGAEVLFDCAGVDATDAFDDVGHSQDAIDMLRPYLVGQLPAHECKRYGLFLPPVPKPARKRRTDDRLRHKVSVAALVLLAMVALVVVVGLQKLQWVKLTA